MQLVARPNHARNVISPFRIFTISYVACNLLHDQTTQGTLFNPFRAFMISCVACILMHDQTTQGTLFNPFRAFMISCVACILMHDQTTQGTLLTRSDIHDFIRSVHLDARPNHARNVIEPFRVFMISCNKLHATILLFSGRRCPTH